jgi:hypothetical protein
MANPASALDDLANSMKTACVSLVRDILTGLGQIGSFDPSQPWFLRQYAAAGGLGLLVMAVMTLLIVLRAHRGGSGRQELQESLVRYLPMGLLMIAFAPAVAALLAELAQSLTDGVISFSAGPTGSVIAKMAVISQMTSPMVPGGAVTGVLLFGLLALGTIAVMVGLAAQQIGVPLAGVASGIAWGMFVHPTWRRKATRVPLLWLGVLFSKPALFFLLGTAFSLIDATLSVSTLRAGGVAAFAQLLLAGLAFLVTGIAPFALVKWAPILPTSAESHSGHSGGGSVVGAVVGAGAGAAVREGSSRLGGGGGQGGRDGSTAAGERPLEQRYTGGQPPSGSPARGAGESRGAGGDGLGGGGGGDGEATQPLPVLGGGDGSGDGGGDSGGPGGAGGGSGGSGGDAQATQPLPVVGGADPGAGRTSATPSAGSPSARVRGGGSAGAGSGSVGGVPRGSATGGGATGGGAGSGGAGSGGAGSVGGAAGPAAATEGAQQTVQNIQQRAQQHAPQVDDDEQGDQ